MTWQVLTWALAWIAATYLVSVGVYLVQGLWQSWYQHWSQVQRLRGRGIVQTVVGANRPEAADLQFLARLPRRLRLSLLAEVIRSLSGDSRRRVQALAADLGLVAWAENRCASRFWWRRLEGARVLTLLEAGAGVVPRLFHDANVDVRTQAAEWAASHPSFQHVQQLLSLLPDPQQLCRFTVQDSLLRIGRAVSDPLRAYLQAHSGPAVASALTVALGVAGPAFREPALRLRGDADPVVRARAATLLGAIGGVDAEDALLEMLADGDPRPRAAAAEAIGAMGVQRAAPALAERLADPAWMVRREAGLALRALGNPGILFLRRALRRDDPFAADMAKHVLDTPEQDLRRRSVTG